MILTITLFSRSYSSASQNELWQYLTNEALAKNHFDNYTNVQEIIETWTVQAGYPEVIVNRNYSMKHLEFRQKRFTYTKTDQEEASLWWIPLSYTTEKQLEFNSTQPIQWMRKTPSLTIEMDDLDNEEWILVNVQQTGFYRVNYDVKNWQLLSSYLLDPSKFTKIAPANRAQLVDDALNLARGLLFALRSEYIDFKP